MALGYDGVIRIDTLINSDGFSKGLKEMSENLDKEVRSSEKLLEELQRKRDEAAKAAQVKDSGLETERVRLAELQQELRRLQDTAKNVRLPDSVRDEAAAQIPGAAEQLERQQENVRLLQAEYSKAASSVEKYDEEIADAAAALEVQRSKAQQAAEALAEAKEELAGIGRSAEVSDRQVVELSHRLAALRERQKTLEDAGLGLGFREYDENVREIAAITAELKEYQAQLQKTPEKTEAFQQSGEKLLGTLKKIGGSFSGSTVNFSQAADGWQEKLEKAGEKLRQTAEEAKKAWDQALAGMKKKAAAVGKALAAAGKAGAALGKNALGALKGMASLAQSGNGFAKISESLRTKLEQLGNTLRRALVFSIAYRGISMLGQEMSRYLAVHQQFSAALAQIKGVLLTAFQPIYDAVVPALATLLNMLSGVIAAVSHFTAALFGTTAKKAQKNAQALYQQAHAVNAVGGAVKDAAEEAKKAIAPFDEFNILAFGDESKGGGSGGAAAMEMPDFDYEYDDVPFDSWGEAFSAFLDRLLDGIPKLEDAFRKFADWLNGFSKKLLDMFTFPGVLKKVERLGRDLAGAFNKLVNWIDWYQLGQALGAGLNLALQFLTEFLYSFDWINLGRKLAEFVNGLASQIDWYDFGRLLWGGFKIGLETLAGFLLGLDMPLLASAASRVVRGFFDEMKNTIERIQWAEIGRQIAAFLNNVDWYGAITSVLAAIAAALTALMRLVEGFAAGLQWSSIAVQIYTAVNDALGKIDWQGIGRTLGDVFIRAFTFLRELVAGIDWYQIGADVGRFLIGIDWVGVLGGLAEVIAAGLNAAIKAVRGLIDTISPDIKEIAHGIAEKINEFFRTVDWAEAGRAISDGLEAALDFALEFIRAVDWNAIGQSIVTLLENIDWASLLTKWGQLVGEAMTAKLEVMNLDGIVQVGVHVVEGLLKGMQEKIAAVGTWLKEHIADPIINGVKELFGIHSPSTVMAEIGENLVAGLLLGISETWSGIVGFFREKFEGIKTEVSAAWENIKAKTSETWSNMKAETSAKWTEIKTAVSEKVDNIKAKVSEGFTKVKETMTGRITEAMNELKGKDWTSIGRGMIDGIMNGLSGIFDKIKGWASNVWNSITGAFSSSNARASVSNSAGRAASYRMATAAAEMETYTLPKLANGAVIPPNQQFMAILGDQRRGTNIEAPLATIEKALQNVMDRNSGNGGGPLEINLVVSGKVLARAVVPEINDMTRSAGKPVLLV